ncbi:B3 domain-containing protein At1g49475-like [Hibiscus syriacus]|uniref:B3 domain-containing protein At1g49475-like n=1 Tax=Hibiscus syriacus TaxID=106335 RepID=UPI001922E321|nr:B3 domain-containing protein At1g49475-like [Hibiscus syriacus]
MASHLHQPHHFFKVVLEDTTRSVWSNRGFLLNLQEIMGILYQTQCSLGSQVELVKCGGKMWFRNGWLNFAKHYSVEPGHFLVFRYEGGCHFHVIIFDRTATEIEYPDVEQEVKVEESDNQMSLAS